MSIPRDIHMVAKNGGFCWAENMLLDRIPIDNPGEGPQLTALYITLCRIASEESKLAGHPLNAFRAGFGRIAKMLGCSRRSVIRWVEKLEEGGFIEVGRVAHNKANADDRLPNCYTLVPFSVVAHGRRAASDDEGGGSG